jgi:iron complex outermembrane receptor protein
VSLVRAFFPSLILLLAAASPAFAQDPDAQLAQNLKKLTIEELTQLDISTASRRVEPLAQAAAAVSVIRGEDIRRAGVTSLAEALRLAEGIAVARADNATWAISTRGFNIPTANKILVLIDGRTVYSPLFAGTLWSVQDVPLANIDRIEVTRGPGGTVWGANAVNGVVNVITKRAAETAGVTVVVAAGTEERGITMVQYGGSSRAFDYRVYGKLRARDGAIFANGTDPDDGAKFAQGGFRLESRARGRDTLLVQGDAYGGREGLFDRPDTHVAGSNVMARWGRTFSPDANFKAQIYYDHVYRRVFAQLRDTRNTFDLDTQQQVITGRHDLLFGGSFRVSKGTDFGNAAFHFEPPAAVNTLGGFFVQDQIALVPRRLTLTVGSKFERNNFTGFETQPSVRVRWTPAASHTVWGAASRAVRLPTRFDTDLRFTNPVSGATTLTGTMDFDTEKVVACELGYRAEASRGSLDVSTFSNVYDDLRSEEFPTRAGQPVVLANLMNARTRGAEIGGTLLILPRWRVHGGYQYLYERFTFDPGSNDPTKGVNEFNDPRQIFKLRSSVDLPADLELDGFLRRVGALPHPAVPGYAELDLRVGWHPSARWELSLVGQNLLHAHHPEFQLTSPTREEYQRGAYVRLVWHY